jgi:hypothetical protein
VAYGLDVISRSQDKVWKEWKPFVQFIEENGQLAVSGLEKLEAVKEKVSLGSLRPALRPLLTVHARASLIPTLLSTGCRLVNVMAASRRAQLAMWVDWHWCKENKYLNPKWGMSLLPMCLSSEPCTSPAWHAFAFDSFHRWVRDRTAGRMGLRTCAIVFRRMEVVLGHRWLPVRMPAS